MRIAIILFLAIATLKQCVSSAATFPAYRVFQYDRGETLYGSRRATLNHVVVPDQQNDPDPSSSRPPNDLARRVVVTSIAQLTPTRVESLVERGAAGILIVLEQDAHVEQEELQRYHEFEQFLTSRAWEISIYFTFSSLALDDMRTSLLNTTSTSTDQFQLVYSGGEATVIPTVTVSNLHGWLHGANVAGESDNAPTIAIVANYDTWGAAPGLAFGVNDNGSGTIALLELTRIFSRLYSEFRTHGHHNILFLLTGAGRLNYVGTKQWLRTIDSRILESIEFVLCIDSIGNGDKLYLHVSRSPKTIEIATLYDRFTQAAIDQSVSLEVIHRKINISKPLINWHHEQFSRKRIVAATISSRAEPTPGFTGSSIFDRRIDPTILKRNIKLIAEALSKQIYHPHPNTKTHTVTDIIIKGSRLNHAFVDAWIKLVSTQSRVTPFMDKKDVIMIEMEKVLTTYTIDMKKSPWALDNTYKFYKEATPVTELSLYRVKPFTFDLYLSLAIIVYAGILHISARLLSGSTLSQAMKL